MLNTVLLFVLVAFSAAEQQQNGAWQPNMEYRYKVQTQTLTAIPNLKNQWVGLMTKVDLTIRPLTKDVLIGKIFNGEHREWHDELPNGPLNQPDDESSYTPMEVNTKPFEIRMNQGAIHSIAVDKDLTNVELNQLKSIISQFQVDIKGRNLIYSPRSQLPENDYEADESNQALYKVMEPTITGKCETVYDINRIPMYLAQNYVDSDSNIELEEGEHFYEIFKTKNYSNCDQRMGYHFGINGLNNWKPNTNLMGSLTKSAVSRVVVSGSIDKFTIRSSVTTNRIVKANPDKVAQHDSVVVSQVNLTLASVERTSSPPEVQSQRLVDVGNLVYSYDTPSDNKNTFRAMKDSSEENNDDTNTPVQNEWNENENENENEQQHDQSNNEHFKLSPSRFSFSFRSRRSVDHEWSKTRRSQKPRDNQLYSLANDENDAYEQDQQFYQPKPTLNDAPENPMLNLFIGNKGRSIQNLNEFNGPAEVQKIAEEISRDLENVSEIPKKDTLRKFNILAKVVRTMDKEQVEQTTQYFERKFNENKKGAKQSRKVYRDALATAGTGPSVVEIMKLIEDQTIKGEEASELISAFPKTIREPTDEMQKRFFEFVKNENVRKQSGVNTTAGIAFTRLLHQAQVNNKTAAKFYPVETYGRLSDRNSEFVPKQVIPYFADILENAMKRNDVPSSLYAIRALGNLGHQEVPSVFEPYLMGKERVSDFQRLAMVLALDKYVENYPHSGPVAPYDLFTNKGETSEVRTAALFLLIKSRPVPLVLQRIAEQTNTEENRDVKAAVRSALKTLSQLTNPEHVEYARHARNALNLLKPENDGIQYSRTHLRDYVIREMDASYDKQSSYIVNKDSFLPNGIFYDSVGNLGGFKRKAEFQAVVSSIEELVNTFADNIKSWQSSNERSYNEENRNYNGNSKWSAEKIIKLLNMQPNKAQQFEGQFLLNLMNSERFLAFDKQFLEKLPEKVKEFVNELRNGVDLTYTKFFNEEDLTISFPLETGLPFTFTYRTPALMHVNGQVKARTTPDIANGPRNTFRMPETVNVTTEVDVVYSILSEVSVSFINPNTRQRYTAGYDKKFQFNVPVRVQNNIDIVNREAQIEIEPLKTHEQIKFLQIGSWPYTTRDQFLKLRPLTESQHLKEIFTKTPRETKFTFGEKATGFEFLVEGKQEKDSSQITNAIKALYKHDFTTLFLFGQQHTSPQHYSLNVILDPRRSTSKTAKVTIKYDSDDQKKTQVRKMKMYARNEQGEQVEQVDPNDNLAVPSSTEPNSKARREQFLRNAVQGMPGSNGAKVLDVAVEFIGSQTREYIATISSAKSSNEGVARILAFVQKASESNQQEKPTKGFYLQVDAKYQTAKDLSKPNRDYLKAYADVDFKFTYALNNILKLASVNGNVQMKQSPELREYMEQQKKSNSPNPTTYKNTVDTIRVVLDTKDMPVEVVEQELGVKLSKIYSFARYATLMYSREDNEYQGEADKVTFEMSLANEMTSANITLKTPKMKTEWEGVPVPKETKYFAVVPANWNIFEELKRELTNERNKCIVSANEVNTFDGRTVKKVRFGNTWHLAAHKMRETTYENDQKKGEHYVSVLVRDAQQISGRRNYNQRHYDNYYDEQNAKKEVLIVLHQNQKNDVTVRLAPRSSESSVPRVYVDEQEQQLNPDETNVVYSRDNSEDVLARVHVFEVEQNKPIVRVVTKMGKLDVTFDGNNVQIRSNGLYRNNRGICGAFTGQPENEMKSPDNRIINNDKDFIASWAVIDDESNTEAKNMQRRVSQKSYPKEEVIYSSPIPNIKKGMNSKYQQYEQSSVSMEEQNNNARSNQYHQNNNNARSGRTQSNQIRIGTKHQTQFIVDDQTQRICFSKRPLPVCQSGYKANGKTIQTVEVHCRNMSDPAAQQYKDQIKRGRSLDMTSHHANGKLKFAVPKRCQQN